MRIQPSELGNAKDDILHSAASCPHPMGGPLSDLDSTNAMQSYQVSTFHSRMSEAGVREQVSC